MLIRNMMIPTAMSIKAGSALPRSKAPSCCVSALDHTPMPMRADTTTLKIHHSTSFDIYSQTSIKRPLKGNVKSGLLKRWSLKKGLWV